MSRQQPVSKLRTISIWTLRVILFQLLLINISAAFHAHRITHYYNSEAVRNMQPSEGSFFLRTWRLMVGRKFPKRNIEYYPQLPYDTVLFKTKNGVCIDAWYLTADSALGTVILFHGLSANKSYTLNEAYGFLSMGYNTLLVDTRAHGSSGGNNNSIGYDESEEVKLAFDYIAAQGEKNIVLYGMSLGAVMITKAVYDYDITASKIILEAPFDRLQDHVKARARVLGFPPEPFGFFVTLWTGMEQGYWGFGHRSSKYATAIQCPVLIQWGTRDPYVKKSEIENIMDAISSKKKLVTYDGAGHQPMLSFDEEKWKQAINDFLSN